MIKPNNRAPGAKGKHANLASLAGNAPHWSRSAARVQRVQKVQKVQRVVVAAVAAGYSRLAAAALPIGSENLHNRAVVRRKCTPIPAYRRYFPRRGKF